MRSPSTNSHSCGRTATKVCTQLFIQHQKSHLVCTEQWGIGGFSSCPCYHPACGQFCRIDCGWAGENDHEFLGSQEEQELAAEEERRRRQAWADSLVAKREQERLRNAVTNQYQRLQENIVVGRDGNILVQGKERIKGVVGGLRMHRAGGVAQAGQVDPVDKKNVALGLGERNLDDIVGGSKLREPKRGSVLFDGPGGVDEPASRSGSISQGKRRSVRSSQYSGAPGGSMRGTTSSLDARRDPPRIPTLVVPGDGTEDTQLNRGVMTPQTIVLGSRPNAPQRPVQGQYTGTKPMVLSPTSEDEPEGTDPRFR